MSIVTIHFWLFALGVTTLYFVVPKRWQWAVILCGNIYFYVSAGIEYLFLMIATSLITYLAALKLDHASAIGTKTLPGLAEAETRAEVKKLLLSVRKFICAIAIVSAGGIWVVLKYSAFFISNINLLISRIHAAWQIPSVTWILPLGISFYTFHLIGYVVDVYRGKYPAQRNFARFFVFVSYFPHMIQGPFSRFNLTGKSILEGHAFSYDRLCEGCSRILWGLSKKLIIADKLSVPVQRIFTSYQDYSGFHILFAIIAYSIELYADFSGYMDIMCGLSHIWGIELPENFRRPYFAKSVDEFWRRWHITLGAWFRDYVFYPVSMGRVGQRMGRAARKKWGARMGKLVPGYFALFFVWTATGLWHGANWTFLVWGYLNLAVIMSTMQLSPLYERARKRCHISSDNRAWQFFSIIRTFLIICFFRFFSSQPSVSAALNTLRHMFIHLHFREMGSFTSLFAGMDYTDIFVVAAGILACLTVDILQETEVWDKLAHKCPIIVKNLIYALLIILLVLLTGGSSDLTGGFMYANF